MGFGLVLVVSVEGSRKCDFTLDWVLLENKGNSLIGYVNSFYLGGNSGKVKFKPSLAKKHQSLGLAGREACLVNFVV